MSIQDQDSDKRSDSDMVEIDSNNPSVNDDERRSGADRRSGWERRDKNGGDFEGDNRRSGKERRSGEDRRHSS